MMAVYDIWVSKYATLALSLSNVHTHIVNMQSSPLSIIQRVRQRPFVAISICDLVLSPLQESMADGDSSMFCHIV